MEKEIGAEGKLKLELVDGKVVVSAVYAGTGLGGQLSVSADADYFLDELAKLVPGDSVAEQFIVGALKTAFRAAKI